MRNKFLTGVLVGIFSIILLKGIAVLTLVPFAPSSKGEDNAK